MTDPAGSSTVRAHPTPSHASEALRSYGGEQGDIRVARRRASLIEAALELLGSSDGGTISVRGVCREAGLTGRYFYESFTTIDDLVSATFDQVIAEISASALDGFARGTTVGAKVTGAVGAIVDVIDADRRKGRLLFSPSLLSPTVAAKRLESTELFAGLTLQSAGGVLDVVTGSADALATAHYQVGGFARVLAAWLDGGLELDRDGVVAVSVRIMTTVADSLEATSNPRTAKPQNPAGPGGVDGAERRSLA